MHLDGRDLRALTVLAPSSAVKSGEDARTTLGVTAKAGQVPTGMTLKPGAEWLKPGLVASVRHLKGEEMLRHASLKSIKD